MFRSKFYILLCVLILALVISSCAGNKSYVKKTNNFGIEAAKEGYWKEARFRFEKLVRKDPTDPIALNNLAVCYEVEGEFEKAIKLYERALELDPENKFIKINIEKARELVKPDKDKFIEIEEER